MHIHWWGHAQMQFHQNTYVECPKILNTFFHTFLAIFFFFLCICFLKYSMKRQTVLTLIRVLFQSDLGLLCLHMTFVRNFGVQNFRRPRWLNWMRRPTGDQEVASSTPAEVGNILSWRLIMKYFLRSFSPFRWFKKGSCQFLAKECAQYWLTA